MRLLGSMTIRWLALLAIGPTESRLKGPVLKAINSRLARISSCPTRQRATIGRRRVHADFRFLHHAAAAFCRSLPDVAPRERHSRSVGCLDAFR